MEWRAPAIAISLLAVACGSHTGSPEPPNILFILADDLSRADVGYHGHAFHETPHIDSLAAEGTVFEQAYAASPVCSPTRASILTGRAPARLHLTRAGYPRAGSMVGPRRRGPPQLALATPRSELALPPDEVTFALRLREKGYATGFIGKWHLGMPGPGARGFDTTAAIGMGAGPNSYYPRYGNVGIEGRASDDYLTDRLTDEALRFIEDHRAQPWLLFVSHFAVHRPWQAKVPIRMYYEDRLRELGIEGNPVIAAMIDSLDEGVGRLLAKLDELGLAERTLVVFTSDNGGLESATDWGDITSNAPYRGGKGWLTEGGIRVPLVVRQPGVVRAGQRVETPVISNDFFPTLLEMAGIAPQEDRELDGVSLVPLLTGKGELAPRPLYFHFPHYPLPSAAVREGNWKLLKPFEASASLYDVEADPSESTNLAAEYPEIAERLEEELDAWLERVDAWLPQPNEAFDASRVGDAASGG